MNGDDSTEVLPMFPLGSTLLPGSAIPLLVFEDRYRRLVVDCLAAEASPPAFGTVLIERGSEVGGDDQRAGVGVLAHMRQISALDDGRYRFVAAGVERLRIIEWLRDDPYPRARVEVWPDSDAGDEGLAELVEPLRRRVESVLELAAEAGLPVHTGPLPEIDDPVAALYQLGAVAPIGPADRYRLLAAETVRERADRLAMAVDEVESSLQFRLNPPST